LLTLATFAMPSSVALADSGDSGSAAAIPCRFGLCNLPSGCPFGVTCPGDLHCTGLICPTNCICFIGQQLGECTCK
jgi:hypothetical protein